MQMYLKSEQAGQVEQTDSFRVLFSLVFFLNWMPFVGNWNRRLVSCISHVASGCLSSRGKALVFFPLWNQMSNTHWLSLSTTSSSSLRLANQAKTRPNLDRPRWPRRVPCLPPVDSLFLCYLMLWRLSVTLLCFLLPRDMDLAWQSLRICSQPTCPGVSLGRQLNFRTQIRFSSHFILISIQFSSAFKLGKQ